MVSDHLGTGPALPVDEPAGASRAPGSDRIGLSWLSEAKLLLVSLILEVHQSATDQTRNSERICLWRATAAWTPSSLGPLAREGLPLVCDAACVTLIRGSGCVPRPAPQGGTGQSSPARSGQSVLHILKALRFLLTSWVISLLGLLRLVRLARLSRPLNNIVSRRRPECWWHGGV